MTQPAQDSRRQRSQAKKKKQLIAVALLSVLLLVVLLRPTTSESSAVAVPKLTMTSARSAPTTTNGESQPIESEPEPDFSIVTALPRIESDAILTIDLFHGPDVSPEDPPVPLQEPSNARAYNVGAVYGNFDSTEKSALIDGDIVRSGDVIDGENAVLSISAEGVTLTK